MSACAATAPTRRRKPRARSIALLRRVARATSGRPVLVGFSGGLDSSVLLHACAASPPLRDRGLRAIHVHHGLHRDADALGRALRAHLRRAGRFRCAVVRVAVDGDAGNGPGSGGARCPPRRLRRRTARRRSARARPPSRRPGRDVPAARLARVRPRRAGGDAAVAAFRSRLAVAAVARRCRARSCWPTHASTACAGSRTRATPTPRSTAISCATR